MKCPRCKGEKFIEEAVYDDHGYIIYEPMRCPVCKGRGEVKDNKRYEDED
jgi:hypothetical protein